MSLKDQFIKTKPGDVGIIGDPVAHSLSPLLQNAAFKTWWGSFRDRDELTPTYHRFHVKKSELKEAIGFLKEFRLRGVNVTVPHKIEVGQHLDLLDPLAASMGAVNTISASGQKLHGYNTDSDGFKRAVSWDLDFIPEGQSVVVLGAGGVGRVIAQALLDMLAGHVFIWNRSPDKLENFIRQSNIPTLRVSAIHTAQELTHAMQESKLIVNATSVGLHEKDGLPAPGLQFSSSHFAFDVIYHRETAFMTEAKRAGARVVGGACMLVYQGARSFEIWTGAPAPVEIMKSVLSQKLQGG